MSGDGKHLIIVDLLEKVKYIENGTTVDKIYGATYYYEYDGVEFKYKNRIIADRTYINSVFKSNSISIFNLFQITVMNSSVILMVMSTYLNSEYYYDNLEGVLAFVYPVSRKTSPFMAEI